jgi:hypothetical protein
LIGAGIGAAVALYAAAFLFVASRFAPGVLARRVLGMSTLLPLLAGELTIRLIPFLGRFFPLDEGGGHHNAFILGLAMSPVYGSIAAIAWTLTGRRNMLATGLRGGFIAIAAGIPLMMISQVAWAALFVVHLPLLWPAVRLTCTDYPDYPQGFESCANSWIAAALLLDGFVIGLMIGIRRKRRSAPADLTG